MSGYRLYSISDLLTETKYDCIYAYNGPEFFAEMNAIDHIDFFESQIQQINPFCLVTKHSSSDKRFCQSDNDVGWSFEQLKIKHINSSDLALWGVQVNTIDDYEYYLLTNDENLRVVFFCNCTDKTHFGTQCQYTFDFIDDSFYTILSSHFANLPEITIKEAAMMGDADVTCYKRNPSCSGGCLDWRQICNGIVDCTHGEDEESCELLEFNECGVDEYRCRFGHCIPIMFAFDNVYDCADASDEMYYDVSFARLAKCYLKVPHMFCDDHNEAWMMFPCGDGDFVEGPYVSCSNERHIRTLKQLYADNGTLCWQYMLCAQYFDFLFPLTVNCDELCGGNDACLSMIPLACPNNTVIFPPNPVMLSPSVYLVYRTNMSEIAFLPHFICYTQCDHIYPPSLKLHGYSCRSFLEFTSEPFYVPERFIELFTNIFHLFAGCVSKNMTHHSFATFQCPLTNRVVSAHRIKDGYQDCYLSLDETYNGSTCALNLTQRYQCWANADKCIQRRFVKNGRKECSDNSDEIYPGTCIHGMEQACDYKRGLYQPTILHYPFKELCDGIVSEPSLFWLLNGTDETDCENAWCIIIPSTRCDGYWDCVDGRDELNCSTELSTKLVRMLITLHRINDCNALEHFCLPVPSSSENKSRSCLSVSRAGDSHIDCWGATDERSSFCNYTTLGSNTWYRCAGNNNICIPLYEICNGHADCELSDDENLCDWLPSIVDERLFYCHNGTKVSRFSRQCNGFIDCANGEDEWFCDLFRLKTSPLQGTNFDAYGFPTYPAGFLDVYTANIDKTQVITRTSPSRISNWYCNRGMPIKDHEQRRCLCPPNYMGERCETQCDRVLVFLQLTSPATLSHEIAIKLVLYLIDITSFHILAEEEILHLPYVHSAYKHMVSLPSIHAKNSFVRIDAYEVNTQQIITYRTSWKFNLPFPFLPVRRLVVRLILSDEINFASRISQNCPLCLRGQCLFYQNSDNVFCLCHNGWVGSTCNISFMCASGAVTLSTHRCLCPMNRHGTRCFVPNIVECQCQNSGTCIPLDARLGKSACLCSDKFFGKHCERIHANLTINFNALNHFASLPVVLIHFVTILSDTNIRFENIFLFEHISTRHPLVVHHVGFEQLPLMTLTKVFYSSSNHHYDYYLVWYMPPDPFTSETATHVHTQLESKQRCLHVQEMGVFKSPANVIDYPHIKRSKYYFRACLDNVTRCFHDEVYLCLCPTKYEPIPRCVIYDHTRETCKEPNNCLNGGLCIENRRKGIVQFSCICPECHYYGALCQFSIGRQGLSLDALVGMEMRTSKPLSQQTVLIKMSLIILITMIIIGFVGNILATMTFARKKSRESGCGWYLLVMSVSNQCALIMFGLRFVYLLVTQMVVWKNRTRSLILCQCLEVGLAVLPNLSNWLSACVSIERTFTVARGALFNQSTSVRTAKWLCIILPLVLIAMAIHEPMTRHLIEDPRLGRYTWCVNKFDTTLIKTIATIFSIFHLLGPFLINLISTCILIFIISRQKLTIRKGKTQKTFTTVLREQIAYYKELIISPVVLLILALPRLVISLGSLCINTSWRNYVFLAGYFISFIPFMATLLIFVLPAPLYRKELKLCILRFRYFFLCKPCRNMRHK